jgi:hypothetical protein
VIGGISFTGISSIEQEIQLVSSIDAGICIAVEGFPNKPADIMISAIPIRIFPVFIIRSSRFCEWIGDASKRIRESPEYFVIRNY